MRSLIIIVLILIVFLSIGLIKLKQFEKEIQQTLINQELKEELRELDKFMNEEV